MLLCSLATVVRTPLGAYFRALLSGLSIVVIGRGVRAALPDSKVLPHSSPDVYCLRYERHCGQKDHDVLYQVTIVLDKGVCRQKCYSKVRVD